jgi:nitrate/nitrite transporter NarK
MGVLSALTTGYWGQLSDRVGRTKIMAVVETGLLLKCVDFVSCPAQS